MFDNTNKSKLSFDKYLSMKSKLIIKNYSEKYKWVDTFLYVFSWFGNVVSIFLAFFFIQTLFYSSFKEVSKGLIITIGIVIFLTLFELLKRYVFSLFSIEFIKQKFKLFKKDMIVFILGTLLLVSGSFYLSLNGAKNFVDNQKIFKTETKTLVSTQNDSIINFYENKKQEYITENQKLKSYNDELRTKLVGASVRDLNRYQIIIDKNDKTIDKNDIDISNLNKEKNDKTSEFKNEQSDILKSNLIENNSNILTFILISSIIELIIMIGVYYDKLYDFKTIEEYEETVINTSEFKTWYKYNSILELIYSSTKNVGDKLPTTDSLIELMKISNLQVTKPEFERLIKLLYNLEIIKKDLNRRILNKSEQEGKIFLKQYFKIN